MNMQKMNRFFNTFLFGTGLVLATGAGAHELPLYVFENNKTESQYAAVSEPISQPVEAATVPVEYVPAAQPYMAVAQPVIATPMSMTTPVQPMYAAPTQPIWTTPMPMTVPVSQSMPAWGAYPVAQAYNLPSVPKSGVDLIDIELPFRCSTNTDTQQDISTTISVKKGDFNLVPLRESDSFPRFEVNGYTFKQKPVDEALQTLVTEAGIAVYAQDAVYPALSATNVYGELSSVIDELTAAADTFYHYDAGKKELLLMRESDFAVSLPRNRLVMLGVLDALRGAGIEAVIPDWGNYRLTLTLTRTERDTVQKLLNRMTADGHLLLADVRVYQSGDTDWNALLRQFGLYRVLSVTDALNGKLLTLKQRDMAPFLAALNQFMMLTPVSSGNLIVPNGWTMRFDIGKCAPFAGTNLSLFIEQSLRAIDTVDTKITVKSNQQDISTFKTVASLDNELAIVGLRDNSIGSEWLMTFQLKLIRLVKEK